MAAQPYTALAVLDRAFRGAVEGQYFDALYGVQEFHALLGRIDLALRGLAVTLAVEEDAYRPVLDIGQSTVDTLPDYRGSVRRMVDSGIVVLADAGDLERLGFDPAEVVAGVRVLDTTALAASWPAYDGVWFL